MESTRIQTGDTERIEVIALSIDNAEITGLSDIDIRIRRTSDDFFYDFNDDTFKNSGWTNIETALSEIDSTNNPGKYSYDFDTSAITNVTANDTYQFTINNSTAVNFPQVGETKVGDYVDSIPLLLVDTTLIKRIVNNKLTIDETNSKLQLWDDTGSSVLQEWPITDIDGNTISIGAGPPTNRGVPV